MEVLGTNKCTLHPMKWSVEPCLIKIQMFLLQDYSSPVDLLVLLAG